MVVSLPRLSLWAIGSLVLGLVALGSAVFHGHLAWTAAAAVTALWAGHMSRRPARRRRQPMVEDVRSLVAGTAGMALAVIAALIAALHYLPHLGRGI